MAFGAGLNLGVVSVYMVESKGGAHLGSGRTNARTDPWGSPMYGRWRQKAELAKKTEKEKAVRQEGELGRVTPQKPKQGNVSWGRT